MKKLFIAAVLSILCTVGLRAQITIKPAVGINFTDWSKNPSTGEYKSKVGYQIGGTVAFGQKISFETGVFYVQKTTEYADKNSNTEDLDFKLKGIRIPAGIALNLIGNEKSPVGVRALGGFSAFFLTNADGNSAITKDDFNDVSWGVYAGAGLNFSIIFIDAQYEWSLTDITKNSVDVGKSRSIFINAGVRIPL